MKYVILRVVCKFSDGSLRTIKYDENHVTEENACNDADPAADAVHPHGRAGRGTERNHLAG